MTSKTLDSCGISPGSSGDNGRLAVLLWLTKGFDMLFRQRASLAFSLVCCLVLLAACGASATSAPNATLAPSAIAGASTSVPTQGPSASAPAVVAGGHEFIAILTVTGTVTKSANFTEPLSVL